MRVRINGFEVAAHRLAVIKCTDQAATSEQRKQDDSGASSLSCEFDMSRTLIQSVVLSALLGPTAVMAATDTYAIDPMQTSVMFEAGGSGFPFNRGRFDKKAGTFSIDRATRSGHVEVTIETGSINMGSGAFDSQLKGKDFFNTEAFPQATFVGDKLLFDGGKLVGVAGHLTLLGRSQPVTVKTKSYSCYQNPAIQREVCGGEAEATIQRSAFGMTYGLPLIPDDIKLVIQIEVVKQ